MWVAAGALDSLVDLIPRNNIVSLVSEYDSFLGSLVAEIINFKPEIFDSKDKNISFSDLMALGTVEAVRDRLVAKEVESVLRCSHSDHFDWMESNFNVKLKSGLDVWPLFIELTERRNLFVHCDGVVSEQYLKCCKKNGYVFSEDPGVGDFLGADKKYSKVAYEVLYEIGVKLTQVLWRKICPDAIEAADASLSYVTYELLIEKNYKLAARLLDFACCTLKRWSLEGVKLIYVVNRALAYKFLGDSDKANTILDSQDWSATGDNYRICVAVLRDQYAEAVDLMARIGNSGSVSKSDYLEWPCFKDFRSSHEFLKAFESIFGEAPVVIEQLDKRDPDLLDLEFVDDSAVDEVDDPHEDSFNEVDLKV